MSDGIPDPTDPAWHQHFGGPSDPAVIEATPVVTTVKTAAQPSFDPGEPWSELPPLKKVPIPAVFELIEALRNAGVPVLGSRPRRAGLLAGNLVNVTISVPASMLGEAKMIVAKRFPRWPAS